MHDTIKHQMFTASRLYDVTNNCNCNRILPINKLTNNNHDKFEKEGYLVLEDFLRPAECEELLAAGAELAQNQPKDDNSVLSASAPFKQYEKNSHFLDSVHKISYFHENVSHDGKDSALSKVGHALHVLHPIFRCYTYSDRVKAVCRQLGLVDPAIAQSMYTYKNPGVLSEVPAHQDSSYMLADPVPVIGFWIALEDSTPQNGCLYISRGSHKSGIHIRLVPNADKDSKEAFVHDRPMPMYPQSSFTAVPVNKGTCVLLHGNVVYKNGLNRSDKSANTYTFHVIEKHNNKYSEGNWLSETSTNKFLPVYTTPQIM